MSNQKDETNQSNETKDINKTLIKRNEVTTKSTLKKEISFENSPLASPDRFTKEIVIEEGVSGAEQQGNSNESMSNGNGWSEVWQATECLNKCDLLSIFTLPNINNLSVGNDVGSILTLLETTNPKTDIHYTVKLLEKLMNDFGLGAFAFLPTSTGKASIGKKCAIWNKCGESKVEIRIRTGAELRRLRFNWEDVLVLQIGPRIVDFQEDQDIDEVYEDSDINSMQSKTITEKRRFVSLEVRGKGYVDLFFPTAKLASAIFHGWSHVVRDFKSKKTSIDKQV